MSGVVRESERSYDAADHLALPSLTDMAGTVVAGPGGWAAVPAVGRLVVWGLGRLVARRVARAAAS
jgi:hypothetical protein